MPTQKTMSINYLCKSSVSHALNATTPQCLNGDTPAMGLARTSRGAIDSALRATTQLRCCHRAKVCKGLQGVVRQSQSVSLVGEATVNADYRKDMRSIALALWQRGRAQNGCRT
jgi:hypothetical protein